MTHRLPCITPPQMQRIYSTLRGYGIPCQRTYLAGARFGDLFLPRSSPRSAQRAMRVTVHGEVWLYDPTQGTRDHRTPLYSDHVNIRSLRWPCAAAAVAYRMIWTDALDQMFTTTTTTGVTP